MLFSLELDTRFSLYNSVLANSELTLYLLLLNEGMAYKGSGKLDTLASLYAKLEEKDSVFKRKIDLIISNNGPGSCLLRLMQISHECNNFPSKLCDIFMEKYQEIDPRLKFYSFNINDILINVTLEDVLFITGLPIDGKPVISDTGYDEGAFLSIFGIDKKVLYITELADIACGQEPDDRRIYAILLIVIVSIVAPTGDGHVCRSSYVQFIKNLDDVNNYAWGAALLSFLYRGMRRYKTEEKKFVDGNTWVLLSFMLFHIPKLQQELQIDLTVQPPTPLLFSVVNSLEKIGRDHYSRYVPKVTALLNSLDATDIKWHPYTREMLPAMVQEQISFTTRLSPLFCLNYVEHHLPHLLAPDSPLTCACTHMGMCIVGDLEYMFVVCSYLACHWRHLVSCHYRIVLHFFGTD